MAQAEATLITPRRNFLVRALAFTAAGAALAVPIVTIDDAKKRMQHHIDGLQAAMKDYYAGLIVTFDTNEQEPERVHAGYTTAGFIFMARLPWEEQLVKQEAMRRDWAMREATGAI